MQPNPHVEKAYIILAGIFLAIEIIIILRHSENACKMTPQQVQDIENRGKAWVHYYRDRFQGHLQY